MSVLIQDIWLKIIWFEMNEDEILKDDEHAEEPAELEAELDAEGKKKKDLIDDDTVSLEDEIDEELDLDKEDLMDDVDEI